MQKPTSRTWDRRLNLVGVVEIAHTHERAVSHHASRPVELPQVQEILDAVLGPASRPAAREQHMLALWARELSHICLQTQQDEFGGDARLRVARIIRIIDIWVEIYVLAPGDNQVMRGETVGSLIDRIAEAGAELCTVRNLRTTAKTSATCLERRLDRLAREYTTLTTMLTVGR